MIRMCFIAVLLLVPTTVVADPTLKAAKIQFHTTQDDKDHDTKLFVWLSAGTESLARLEGFANDTRCEPCK